MMVPERALPLNAACRILTGDGNGAGFLLTHDGLVATCAHGTYEGQTVRVQVGWDRLYTGRVVARRPSRDLALIRIDGVAGLPTVRLGDPGALTPGERLFVVAHEQLPASTLIPTEFPDRERTGRIGAPLVLEVGFAGGLYIHSVPHGEERDDGFVCVLTTRTDQVRPGSSGAMVCALDGAVVGIHVGALSLGSYGQEVSAVELQRFLSESGHDASTTTTGDEKSDTVADEIAKERWERVRYAIQCLELVRRRPRRNPEDAARDLKVVGDAPSEDPEVSLARMHSHLVLGQGSQALACARAAIERNGLSALSSLGELAPHDSLPDLTRFLTDRIATMPDLRRRNVLRSALARLLNDAGEHEGAAACGEAGGDDAYADPDSAGLRMECARAYSALGRTDEADEWLRRAAWARDAEQILPADITRIAAASRDPNTRVYGLRHGLKALVSGRADEELMASLGRLCAAQNAPEAAALFVALERAFAPVASLSAGDLRNA